MAIAALDTVKASGGGRIISAKPKIRGKVFFAIMVAIFSFALLYVVSIYESALRDARYFDGWLLAFAMTMQIYFHARRKLVTSSAIANKNWRKVHIFTGYVVIFLFLSHSNYTLPDEPLEWAMWTCVVLISLSGIFGTYLTWAAQAKLRGQDEISLTRIPKRRAELASEVQALVQSAPQDPEHALPIAPYNAWIEDFYRSTLRGFLARPQNFMAHLAGSQRHMKKVIEEFEGLDRYLNQEGREKLVAVRSLVLEKDRLDFALVQQRMSKIWLLVHLPLTYSLIVMIVLHVIIVYAFASGVW